MKKTPSSKLRPNPPRKAAIPRMLATLRVRGVFMAPLAKLRGLELFRKRFLVLGAVVIDPLARRTLEFDEIVLAHEYMYFVLVLFLPSAGR